MRLLRLLIAATLLTQAVGCSWLKSTFNTDNKDGRGEMRTVSPEELVGYLNDRSARLQSVTYGDARMRAFEKGIPLPMLRGDLAATQPRNFRMVGTGAVGGKIDLGSNAEQFWVYADAPTVTAMYVFASHTDFQSGRAKIPGGIPFDPDWVMQALGMSNYPPGNNYTVVPNPKERTLTLWWPATTPNGIPVRKEIVFDAENATGTRPQVKKHIVKDARGNPICTAEIKSAKTVQTGAADPRSGLPLAVQYPTAISLKWVEQKFELDLTLDNAQVNPQLAEEATRRLFSRPTIPGTTPVDLANAKYEFKPTSK